MARRIHQSARENELEVERRQRLLENVGREIQVVDFVALHRLPQKRRVQQQGESGQQQQVALQAFGYAGFHRSTGLRAAVTSSTRLVRVEWGASSPVCGSVLDFLGDRNHRRR